MCGGGVGGWEGGSATFKVVYFKLTCNTHLALKGLSHLHFLGLALKGLSHLAVLQVNLKYTTLKVVHNERD